MHEKLRPQLNTTVHEQYRCGAYVAAAPVGTHGLGWMEGCQSCAGGAGCYYHVCVAQGSAEGDYGHRAAALTLKA